MLEVNCPDCHRRLRLSQELPGQLVQCPICGRTFAVLSSEGPTEGAGFNPVTVSPAPGKGRPTELLQDRLSRRFDPEQDEDRPETGSRSVSWGNLLSLKPLPQHYKAVFWPMTTYLALCCFVLGLLLPAPPPLAIVGLLLLLPPLFAGFLVVALAELKGNSWTFLTFFSGWRWFVPLLLHQFVVALAFSPVVLLILDLMSGMQGVILGGPFSGPALLTGVTGLGLFAAYFLFRAFGFSVLLILDRNCSPLRAIQGSWALTRGRFWALLHVVFVSCILLCCSSGMCIVGLPLTFPAVILIWTGWYLDFGGAAVSETSTLPDEATGKNP